MKRPWRRRRLPNTRRVDSEQQRGEAADDRDHDGDPDERSEDGRDVGAARAYAVGSKVVPALTAAVFASANAPAAFEATWNGAIAFKMNPRKKAPSPKPMTTRPLASPRLSGNHFVTVATG